MKLHKIATGGSSVAPHRPHDKGRRFSHAALRTSLKWRALPFIFLESKGNEAKQDEEGKRQSRTKKERGKAGRRRKEAKQDEEGKIAVKRSSYLTSRNTAAAFELLPYPSTPKGRGKQGRPWMRRFCSRNTISPTSWRGPKGTCASTFEWSAGQTACRMWEKTALSGKARETAEIWCQRRPLTGRVTRNLWKLGPEDISGR